MKRITILSALSAYLLAGCSITGLSGSSRFACNAPDGVSCMSVSSVYSASVAGTLANARPAPTTQSPMRPFASTRPPTSGEPMRSPPRVLRVWLAPIEDADGDFRDQAYLYITANSGRWNVEHTRSAVRDEFQPLRRAERAPVPVSKEKEAAPSEEKPRE